MYCLVTLFHRLTASWLLALDELTALTKGTAPLQNSCQSDAGQTSLKVDTYSLSKKMQEAEHIEAARINYDILFI